MAKYAIADEDITVDGEPIAQVEILPGELHEAQLMDLIAAANRALERRGTQSAPFEVPPGLVNDLDESGAAGFLVKYHVPFIGPDMGTALIAIVKRLEVVKPIYPLPDTVEAYRLALHLLLQVAAQHQSAFCAHMEEVLAET